MPNENELKRLTFAQEQILALIPAQAFVDYKQAKKVLETTAQAQLEADRKVVDALEKRIADIKANRLTYCAYCGAEFPIDAGGTPKAVSEHILTCGKHPIHDLKVALEAEVDAAKAHYEPQIAEMETRISALYNRAKSLKSENAQLKHQLEAQESAANLAMRSLDEAVKRIRNLEAKLEATRRGGIHLVRPLSEERRIFEYLAGRMNGTLVFIPDRVSLQSPQEEKK